MYHQITLEESGLIPRQELPVEKKTDRSRYASFCGGCICEHCANSMECADHCTGESDFGCFNCDDCKGYDEKGTDNWRTECAGYKVTEAYAVRMRRCFKSLNTRK